MRKLATCTFVLLRFAVPCIVVLSVVVVNGAAEAEAEADATSVSSSSSPSSSRLDAMTFQESAKLLHLLSGAADVMSRRRQGRTSISAASSSVAAGEEEDASNHHLVRGGSRLLASSCSDKLDKCKSNLKTCEKAAAEPTFLFTQMADTCKLKRKTDGKGVPYFEWSSKDMDDDTYVFSDRPYQIAYTMPTEDFFGGFEDMFNKKNGGKPNGAITFRHHNTEKFEGPLLSVFVEAAHKTDAGKFVYRLRQSEDHEAMNALDDFFDSKGDDVVEFEMCSLFIDHSFSGVTKYIGELWDSWNS